MRADHLLANGLRVLAVERRHAPVTAVSLRYAAGSRNEPPGRTGLAHLAEHLMFQGSANVAPGEHAALMEGLGAPYDGETWFEHTVYHQSVPSGQLELALWLEADRMGTLPGALAPAALRAQREVVRNEVRQRLHGTPYGTRLPHLFALAHPYTHTPLGTEEDLDAITFDDCARFLAGHCTPANAVLAVVGDVAAAEVAALADRFFGRLRGPRPAPPPDAGSARTGRRLDVVEDQPGEALFIAVPLPSEPAVPLPSGRSGAVPFGQAAGGTAARDGTAVEAAELALDVLARGAGSRLHRRLVQRDGLALSVEAVCHRFSGACSLGVIEVTSAPGAPLGAIEEAVDEESADLARHGPRPGERDRATALARARHLDGVGTAAGLADELTLQCVLTGDPWRALTAPGRTASVDDAALTAAALHLTRPHWSVLAYHLDTSR
ncbi:M16 family metallopeptidase [Nonomuraea pusilla]|uniref:Predicted Zn-dependent peptidase n=1 Tax=Nonomuraea pusilla TaxID=46177 RepID=A0A1H7NX30_9ACTN|nr:pitrilysin family protein [Nonomuraea pusilla]SEL28160.1 Predicted Zn-dependent peptidase [Nonomuraea pusilla]